MKYTDFSQDQIEKYLDNVRQHVQKDRYAIAKSVNRLENINFIEDYKIDTQKEKNILLSLTYKDFCYAVDNEKEAYSYETLYIFCRQKELDYWGSLEVVDIYIKINITEISDGSFMYIVSFHKRNKPIKYLFNDKN
ncbi:MAG: hypothetical protein ACOCRO_08235 [Halanaerobiales bacterium]